MKRIRIVVLGDSHRPPYVQEMRCGRHVLTADQPSHRGGLDAGPSPLAYVLSALGACTSVTVLHDAAVGSPAVARSVPVRQVCDNLSKTPDTRDGSGDDCALHFVYANVGELC